MRPGATRAASSAGQGAEARMLAATERLLERVPLRDLSVEDILAEAKVSRRTFYVYFASKYGVIMRLGEQALGDIFENLAPLLGRDDSEHGPEALERVIRVGSATWAEHRDLLRAIVDHWQEVDDLREVWLTTMARMGDALAAEIERERAAGYAPPGPDAQVLASTLLWATAHVLHAAWLDDVETLPTQAAVIDSITTMWVGSIYGLNGTGVGSGPVARSRPPRST